MSGAKLLLRVVVGLVTGAAVYFGLAFLTVAIGGSDCDRGDCNFIGDAAADGSGRWLLALAYIAVAVGLGVTSARSVR
jgi:hypothetical protein